MFTGQSTTLKCLNVADSFWSFAAIIKSFSELLPKNRNSRNF